MPKNLYLKEGELEKEACTITEDSIYQSVTLTKGQVIYNCLFFIYRRFTKHAQPYFSFNNDSIQISNFLNF